MVSVIFDRLALAERKGNGLAVCKLGQRVQRGLVAEALSRAADGDSRVTGILGLSKQTSPIAPS